MEHQKIYNEVKHLKGAAHDERLYLILGVTLYGLPFKPLR
jgi:hypothetical protein